MLNLLSDIHVVKLKNPYEISAKILHRDANSLRGTTLLYDIYVIRSSALSCLSTSTEGISVWAYTTAMRSSVSCSKASSLSASDCLAPSGSSLMSRFQLLFLIIAFVLCLLGFDNSSIWMRRSARYYFNQFNWLILISKQIVDCHNCTAKHGKHNPRSAV